MSKEIYFESIISQIPRLLGLLNRNIGSLTYGCFDRQYWHYRIVDFPCARYQEAVLALALLYKLNHSKNLYFKNPNILEWINAAVEFWSKIQEKDGSFNEWYPHEKTFVATSFSTYAISETALIMEDKLIKEYRFILDVLKRAADWLSPMIEEKVLNQTCGAVAALYNIYLLTGEHKYLVATQKKLDFLEKKQDLEGWLTEYGGLDMGYLSLAIDYLTKYYEKSKDETVFRILKKAILIIHSFIHSDYTFGGSFTSRNTEYFIPSGFEIMAKYLLESKDIAIIVRDAIAKEKTVIPAFLDDRYLAYMGYTYLQAFINAQDMDENPKYQFRGFSVEYPHLGIGIISGAEFHFVYNYKKGGTFKIVFSNNKSLRDWGAILISSWGKKYFSGWLNTQATCYKNGERSFEINTQFQEIKQLLPSPLKYIASRIFLLTLGSYGLISVWLKSILRDKMIINKKNSPIMLSRILSLKGEKITIVDRIKGARGIKTVILNAKVSYIYTPSSCYYQPSDLENQTLIYERPEPDIKGDEVVIVRDYNLKGELTSLKYNNIIE